MSSWSVSAVGGNPHAAAYLGAVLNTGTQLGLPGIFSGYVSATLCAHWDLTSPWPLGGKESERFTVAEVSVTQPLSPLSGIPNMPGRSSDIART